MNNPNKYNLDKQFWGQMILHKCPTSVSESNRNQVASLALVFRMELAFSNEKGKQKSILGID
jgi:hypothetical protein